MVFGKPGRKSQSGRKPPQADHAPLALFLAKVPGYITCSPVATPKTRTAPSHDRAYRGIPHGFAAHRHARFQPAWDRAAQSGEAQERQGEGRPGLDDKAQPIKAFVDSNFDDKVDIVVDDTDRDGKWDVSLHDVDFNESVDLVGHHPDGRTAPSRYENYAVAQ
jgi:hypothetical protein